MNIQDKYREELDALKSTGNFRSLPEALHDGKYITRDNRTMLNLSSNDYLGLAEDMELRKEFLASLTPENFIPSSSSSRLLTGNFTAYTRIEELLKEMFHSEAALVFNSGYHMNIGILPAVTNSETLIIADKLVHASIIDGILLSQCKFQRYKHSNYTHLERLLDAQHDKFERIIIVTESIFSMDGDEADLKKLVELKHKYNNVMLYVDEAHGIGVRGEHGLGCAEEQGVINDIDFLCGTFGKAIASVGAYIICSQTIRDYLINKMRSFIFTTALPPINIEWTEFILRRLSSFSKQRENLKLISSKLKQALADKGFDSESTSHILPMTIGKSEDAIIRADQLQRKGFYALPVRPPTVPEGTSRIRFSLTAAITKEEIDKLIEAL